MLLKLAWRNIWRNKRRSIITIASILFAVFFAVIARSFQLGTYDVMVSGMVESSTGYIQLHKKGYWDDQTIENSMEMMPDKIEEIRKISGVELVAPRIEGFALSAYKDMTKAVRVNGIEPEKEENLTHLKDKLIAGEYNYDNKILITEGLSSYYELQIGDTIYLLGQGYHATTAAGKYVVGGVLKFGNPLINDAGVYLDLQEAQKFFTAPDLITGYVIDIDNPESMEEIQKQVVSKIDTAAIEVLNWKEMLPELIQAIEMDSAGGVLMIFILYMVVSFGIFGTILMMTAERKKEFGVMISIGMKRWKLSIVAVVEIIMLAILGVIAGLIVATPLAYYFNVNPIEYTGQTAEAIKEYGMEPIVPTSIDPSIAYTHGVLILVIAVILALYPVMSIKKLKTVDAMRG